MFREKQGRVESGEEKRQQERQIQENSNQRLQELSQQVETNLDRVLDSSHSLALKLLYLLLRTAVQRGERRIEGGLLCWLICLSQTLTHTNSVMWVLLELLVVDQQSWLELILILVLMLLLK